MVLKVMVLSTGYPGTRRDETWRLERRHVHVHVVRGTGTVVRVVP